VIYLVFSILSSVGLFAIFKLANKSNLNIILIIILNYLVASVLGYFLSYSQINSSINTISIPTLVSAFIIGALFIGNFVLINMSTKQSGIAITTVMSKMSVIIPILFTLIYFSEIINVYKIIGIITALLAIFLTVYKKEDSKSKITLVPIVLFVGMGITDIVMKYAQNYNLENNVSAEVFSTLLFLVSFIVGVFWFLTLSKEKKKFKNKDIFYGVTLGVINFGTVYFFINALSSNTFNSSVLFGINHTSIVIVSVLIGSLFFKEKLSKINLIGILFSVISIILLTKS